MKTDPVDSIKGTLSGVFERYKGRVLFAYVFGSAAGEEATPLSDLDIAVFLSEGTREFYSDTRLCLSIPTFAEH